MIAIVDNGEGYEDHDTLLVEVASRDHAEKYVAFLADLQVHPDAKLLGTADEVTWIHGSAQQPSAQFEFSVTLSIRHWTEERSEKARARLVVFSQSGSIVGEEMATRCAEALKR